MSSPATHDLRLWQHSHDFGTVRQQQAERRTRWVVALTFFAMLIEIAVGWLSGSMSLFADGWHMANLVGVLGIAAFASHFSRQHAGTNLHNGQPTRFTSQRTEVASQITILEMSSMYAHGQSQRLSPAGLAVVVALHGVVFYALLQMNVTRLPVEQPLLRVELLTPSTPELPKQEIELPKAEIVHPKPRPMDLVPRPLQEVPPLANPTEAPVATPVAEVPPLANPAEASVTSPATEVPPLATPAKAPAASPAAEVPLAVPPAPTFTPPAPKAPAELSKPRFDADYLDNPKPIYPAISRRLKEEGRVVLRVQVAANGLPIDVTVHSSSGSERLDKSALDAVRRWKFVPARLGNDPVDASVLVPIVFSLKD